MGNFVIFTDSSADLHKIEDINVIPFSISFDGENYLKENIDITLEEFYKKLPYSSPKTSLPSINEYINSFEPYLKKGLDILCICLSSTLSGSYQSAINAKSILEETYKENKIIIIDSNQVSGGQGLLVLQALEMKNANFDINTIAKNLEILKQTIGIFFIPDTLDYLQKGGRIGKASSVVGNLLNIKPIFSLENGEVVLKSKSRGKNKAISELISYVENIKEDINNYYVVAGSSNNTKEAISLLKKLEEKFNIKIEIPIFNVGVTIGSHVGPNAIGLGFIKKYTAI